MRCWSSCREDDDGEWSSSDFTRLIYASYVCQQQTSQDTSLDNNRYLHWSSSETSRALSRAHPSAKDPNMQLLVLLSILFNWVSFALDRSPELLGIAGARFLTGQAPVVSPNWCCHSTEAVTVRIVVAENTGTGYLNLNLRHGTAHIFVLLVPRQTVNKCRAVCWLRGEWMHLCYNPETTGHEFLCTIQITRQT